MNHKATVNFEGSVLRGDSEIYLDIEATPGEKIAEGRDRGLTPVELVACDSETFQRVYLTLAEEREFSEKALTLLRGY